MHSTNTPNAPQPAGHYSQAIVHNGALVRIIGLHEQAHHEFRQLGLAELVGRENCVDTVEQAFAIEAAG